jgi:hypothetical protein
MDADQPDPELHSVGIEMVHIYGRAFSGLHLMPISRAKFPMASNSTVHTLPNPNTPLAFLPPILAEEFEVSSYVVIGGLSASMP